MIPLTFYFAVGCVATWHSWILW